LQLGKHSHTGDILGLEPLLNEYHPNLQTWLIFWLTRGR
jgi:hypothetical protein